MVEGEKEKKRRGGNKHTRSQVSRGIIHAVHDTRVHLVAEHFRACVEIEREIRRFANRENAALVSARFLRAGVAHGHVNHTVVSQVIAVCERKDGIQD